MLIELTKPLKGTQTGNVIFWLTIMLGQPMIVLLYARDYQTGMYGPWTEADSKFLFFYCVSFCFVRAIGALGPLQVVSRPLSFTVS